MTAAPRSGDFGEIVAVAILAWLLASGIIGLGFTVYAAVEMLRHEPWSLIMLPIALFIALAAAGFASLPWALPTGLLLVFALRAGRASPVAAWIVSLAVAGLYAAGLSRMPLEWQWWSDFWFVAPVYGATLALMYARTFYG